MTAENNFGFRAAILGRESGEAEQHEYGLSDNAFFAGANSTTAPSRRDELSNAARVYPSDRGRHLRTARAVRRNRARARKLGTDAVRAAAEALFCPVPVTEVLYKK